MKYTASYDTTVKIVSSLVILLMLFTAFYLPFILGTGNYIITIITFLLCTLISLCILLICYVYSPQYYILNDDSLVIKRVVKNRVIMLIDISELRLIQPVELRGVIRTFGVGGLFGYFGKFASLKLGSMTWYCTQRRNRVLISLKTGEKIVITPDEKTMLEAIKAKTDK